MTEKKILIVDDEPYTREMLKDAFEIEQYIVLTAESGEEALNILKKETIHVMFLDLKLQGMSGVELCREVRKNIPVAIIYAITGFASFFQIEDCLGAGFNDYFIKPVSLDVLFKAAGEAFEKLERWDKQHAVK